MVCGRSKNVGLPIAMLLHADGAGEGAGRGGGHEALCAVVQC